VYLLPCNGNEWQKWSIRNPGVSTTWLHFVHVKTGKCLDTNGTAIYKVDCDRTGRNAHQMWQKLHRN
jgi:hypothetical protein